MWAAISALGEHSFVISLFCFSKFQKIPINSYNLSFMMASSIFGLIMISNLLLITIAFDVSEYDLRNFGFPKNAYGNSIQKPQKLYPAIPTIRNPENFEMKKGFR